MIRISFMVAGLCALLGAGAQANTVGCGGNSFSYVEVKGRQRGHRPQGPIVVGPDSLCADLIEHRRSSIQSLDVTIDPRQGSASDGQPAQEPR